MEASIFIARLIGPIFLLLALAIALDRTRLTVAGREFLGSPALILTSALLSLLAGLAIVNSHNIWSADWRVLVTLFGWLALIAGAVRLVLPRLVQRQGNGLMNRVWPMWLAAAVVVVYGLVLTWAGYFA